MFVIVYIKLETLTTLGKVTYTDKNSTQGSKTTKLYIIQSLQVHSVSLYYNKTLFNVVFDQSISAISGIFWAVKTADKLTHKSTLFASRLSSKKVIALMYFRRKK